MTTRELKDALTIASASQYGVVKLDTEVPDVARVAALEAAQGGGDASSGVSYLVSGGSVVWQSGYTYRVSPATYYLRGTLLTSAQTDVTLGAAHATLDRIDVIVADSDGTIAVVAGTAAAAPAEPAIDPFDQLQLAIVSVPANTTQPTITRVTIYDEGSGGEWAATAGGSGFNVASTSNPLSGTKTIEATAVGSGASVTLTPSPARTLANTAVLSFGLRSKAAWPSKRGLSLYFRNSSGARVGNAVTLAQGAFGLDTTQTTTYQQVAIGMSAFAVPDTTTITDLRIDVTGSGGTFGFYLDTILLDNTAPRANTTPQIPLASPTATGTVKTTTRESDPTVYTATEVDDLLASAGGGDSTTTATYASRPAAGNAGDLFLPSDGVAIERDNGTTWAPWGPLFPLTAPVSGDFAWVNQGGATVDTTHGGVILRTDGSGSTNLRIRKKAAPSTPYTIDLAFIPNFAYQASSSQNVGFVWRQSSDGKLHAVALGVTNANDITLWSTKYTNPTTFSAHYSGFPITATALFYGGGPIFFRAADNGTNRVFSISANGQTWFQIDSQGSGDFLTANEVGFFVSDNAGSVATGMTLLSWKET